MKITTVFLCVLGLIALGGILDTVCEYQDEAYDLEKLPPLHYHYEKIHIKNARDDLSELFINHSEADIDAEKTLAEFKKKRHEENLLTKKEQVQAFNNLFARK